MIYGIGTDVVEIARVGSVVDRWGEHFLRKVFTERELAYARSRKDSIPHIAARFAVKEAVAKALGAPPGLHWHDAQVPRTAGAPPVLEVTGTVAARAAELGIARFHVSISHDAGIASAVVIAERD